jgi:two-component system sensor histidine kinase KdpD
VPVAAGVSRVGEDVGDALTGAERASVTLRGRPVRRYVIAVALVVGVTAAARLLAVDPPTAALLLLGAVLLAALRGRRAGLLAAVLGAALLLAFLVVVAVVGTSGARAYHLQVAAEQRRREAEVRLRLINDLLSGESPSSLAGRLAESLVELFLLSSCTVRVADSVATERATRPPGTRRVDVRTGAVTITAVPSVRRPLSDSDAAVLDALAAGLATALDNVRLQEEANQVRVATTLNRVRSSFLSLVSHNLRTPLAAIKASVATLQDGDLRLAAEQRAELRAAIAGEAERLERLVRNVLDLSRVRGGGLELNRTPTDAEELATTAVRRLLPLAGDRRMVVEMPEDLPEVIADETWLEQVFLNLLENALRFAPAHSEIRVRGRAAAGAVEVSVSDRGPGVPPEHRSAVFDEFARLNGSRDSTGTGLGLAIVRAVVDGHGGRVWCEETPGGGATFVVRLPAAGATGAPEAPEKPDAPEKPEAAERP